MNKNVEMFANYLVCECNNLCLDYVKSFYNIKTGLYNIDISLKEINDINLKRKKYCLDNEFALLASILNDCFQRKIIDEEFYKKLNFDYYGYYEFIFHYLNKGNFSTKIAFDVLTHMAKVYIDNLVIDDELENETDYFFENIFLGILNLDEKVAEKFNDYEEKDKDLTFKVIHVLIKRMYFDRIDTYNIKDAQGLILLFSLLGNDPCFIDSFYDYLNAKIIIRDKKRKEKTNNINSKINIVVEEPKNKISHKEYNKIYREILESYDLDNQRTIKPLSLKDIIYLTSLMYKINIDENEIKKFVQNANKDFFVPEISPFMTYMTYLPKIKYYLENNEELKKALDLISSYVNEMLLMRDDRQEYYFWKDCISEEMKEIYLLLKDKYAYELEEGKKRSEFVYERHK